MPLTNSYLIIMLVHMFWHAGELHMIAPLALLFHTMSKNVCVLFSGVPGKHIMIQNSI